MNSRLTLVLAGVLLVGAVVTGYWGLSIGREPATLEPEVAPTGMRSPARVGEQLKGEVQERQRTHVVVLARDVQPLAPLVAEDLLVERLLVPPPGSFSRPEQLIGRSLWWQAAAGTVLNKASFDLGGPLGKMIRAQERAIAVAVDEVIGGGGHLRPGDFVDVLLYLRQDEKNRDQTAQVLIPALRLLSVGADLGATNDGEVAQPQSEPDERRRRGAGAATTAVLAVPEALLTRFMLATQVGTLRLAVRSVDEKLLAAYYAGEQAPLDIAAAQRQLFQFEQLALHRSPVPQAQPGPGLAPSAPAGIQIYRGNAVSRQTP